MKPSKSKQKIRKVRFLWVMIRLKEIKIEKENVKKVLDQSTSKEFKNIQKFLGLANYYLWFIKDFMSIAGLLHDLVKNDQKWDQTEK